MNKLFYIVFIGVFFFTACKKEEFELPDESVSETPIFKIEGTIGNQSVNFVAGVDSAFQQTSIEMLNGINYFTGKMTKGNTQLSLSISDGKIGLTPTITDFSASNLLMSHTDSSPWFSATLQNLPYSQYIQSVNYTVNGMQTGSNIDIISKGYHQICANVMFTDGTSRSICNTVLLGYKDHGSFNVKYAKQSGGETNLWIEPAENQVESVKWFVNDVYHSDGIQSMIGSNYGIAKIKAAVTFQNGITREHTVIVDTYEGLRNFVDMESLKTMTSNQQYNDFKLSIGFQNESGIYTSYATNENPGSFQLDGVTLYKTKPNGNKIYKVSGTINSKFVNIISGDLLPSQLKVVIAIELPY
jgi:hypothetical protein